MTIKSVDEINDRGIEIDLTGPDGNAFALMANAQRLGKQLDFDVDAIIEEMMAKEQ